jgi:hypothetical protein
MERGTSMGRFTGISINVVLCGVFSTNMMCTPLYNFLYSLFYSYLIENWILHTRPQFTSFINVNRGTCHLILTRAVLTGEVMVCVSGLMSTPERVLYEFK